jgi:hypothetical protein
LSPSYDGSPQVLELTDADFCERFPRGSLKKGVFEPLCDRPAPICAGLGEGGAKSQSHANMVDGLLYVAQLVRLHSLVDGIWQGQVLQTCDVIRMPDGLPMVVVSSSKYSARGLLLERFFYDVEGGGQQHCFRLVWAAYSLIVRRCDAHMIMVSETRSDQSRKRPVAEIWGEVYTW